MVLRQLLALKYASVLFGALITRECKFWHKDAKISKEL
jgi:hypothetical protein